MRKALLLAILLTLGATGVAYAAVTNNYVIQPTTKAKPVKSGTKSHPKPAGLTLDVTISTTPANQRPNVVKTEALTIQGSSENTTKFPVCSTSRLLNKSEGPSTCPKKSLAGTGDYIVLIGPTGNQSSNLPPCRADFSLYNGGNHDLSFYLYKGTESNACALPQSYAIDVPITKSKKGLTSTVTFPDAVLHPANPFPPHAPLDAAPTSAHLTLFIVTKKVKGKKIGLFNSIKCPASKKRQIALKFTLPNGTSQTATRGVKCK